MSSGSSFAASAVEATRSTKHHRQLPTLGLGMFRSHLRPRRTRGGRVGLRQAAQGRNSIQQPSSVTDERNAEIVQVGGGQRGQQLDVNRMLVERLLVALQPQLQQPRRDIYGGSS
jgi:hypothetical protein